MEQTNITWLVRTLFKMLWRWKQNQLKFTSHLSLSSTAPPMYLEFKISHIGISHQRSSSKGSGEIAANHISSKR